MFRSIKGRLVASYVLLTLLTVSVLGALAFSSMYQYVKKQETDFLTVNAETISEQASQFLWPTMRPSELRQLANTSSILANIRVRIYDAKNELLVDTGPYTGVDQFIWVQPFETLDFEAISNQAGAFIIPFSLDVESNTQTPGHIISSLVENFPKETRISIIQRIPQSWGYQMSFKDPSELMIQMDRNRSSQVLSLPIGEPDHPLGYVELLDGPNYGTETLKTMTRAFLMAAGGSLLLAGIVGLLISGRLTSPITQLSEVAAHMSSGDLSVRAPTFGKDEIGQLAQRFNEMAERLEESFKALASERDTLRRFITDASHELRTPITALKNFNELLLDKKAEDPQAQEDFLTQSQDQIERLEWITQNLLDLSRLEAGITALKQERSNVKEILEHIASTFILQAERKEVRFLIEYPDPNLEIYTDPSFLEIALNNLLDNALKYTSTGGKIKLGAYEENGKIHLRVQDTGIGIDPVDMPFIFERFYRGKSVTDEGSGLGLAMVESVVKAHGGNIYVESEPGIGSTFTIEIPKFLEEGK